jgi:cysteine desulfurase family protein (TIGR01976 family)
MALDVMLARAQFPALSGSWIYMDNGGGTQVPLQVADAVRDYLLTSNVQVGGTSGPSKTATERLEAARRFTGEWIGALPDEIVFGANTSQLLRVLALVLSARWQPDDEVIISQAEHEANAGCWEYLEQFGIVIRTWEIDPETYTFDLGALTELLSEKTRLIAVHHTSNILGNVMPIKEVVKLARGTGAQVCVDGVAHVPHRKVDVKDLGVDYYAFSPYKAYGPHLGVLYVKHELLEKLPRWNHFFIESEGPRKLELGTGNHEGMAGLLGLEKYFRAVGKDLAGPVREVVSRVYEEVGAHETKLTRSLLGYLAGKPRVTLLGQSDVRGLDDRLPIFSFLVDGVDPEELVQELDKSKIGMRWGHFYSVRLLDRLDLLQYKGVLRVSLAHYNSEAEVARLKDVLEKHIS